MTGISRALIVGAVRPKGLASRPNRPYQGLSALPENYHHSQCDRIILKIVPFLPRQGN